MKRIFLLSLLPAILFSCSKPHLNDAPPAPIIVLDTFFIERSSVGSAYANAVIISTQGSDKAHYQLVDKNYGPLSSGTITMDISRDDSLIKADVFSTLILKDLRPIEFIIKQGPGYIAFPNLIDLGNEQYGWFARHGTTHLNNGSLYYTGFNSLNRSFTSEYIMPKLANREDVRGGWGFDTNDSIYYFAAIYKSGENRFLRLSLFKSPKNNISWGAEKVLLYCVGANNGINETTFNRFNFYGGDKSPNGQKIVVGWFEHNSAGKWRTNFLYSENNFTTWETRNIPQGPGDKIGEAAIKFIDNDRLISIGRQDAAATARQQYCSDITNNSWLPAWQVTNIGAGAGRVMSDINISPEHGLMVIYGDRGTSTVKLSFNNDVESVLLNPMGYNTGKVIYTTGAGDPFRPLGYPSIVRVAPGRYMMSVSEEITDNLTAVSVCDGGIDHL